MSDYQELELSSHVSEDMMCVMDACVDEDTRDIVEFVYRTGRKATEDDQPTRQKYVDWHLHETLRDAIEYLLRNTCGEVDEVAVMEAQAKMCTQAFNVLKGEAA